MVKFQYLLAFHFCRNIYGDRPLKEVVNISHTFYKAQFMSYIIISQLTT